jgi:glyoxalase family protein
MKRVNGLHHITAISGPAQENLDFYAGILGMHLVKRSVNQDDPGTYHLFYADAEGSPGSDLTFFPWPATGYAPRFGYGLAVDTSLEVPGGSLDYWGARLQKYGVKTGTIETRFADRCLPVVDTHGFHLTLVESANRPTRLFTVHTVGRQCGSGGTAGSRSVWRTAMGAERGPDESVPHEDSGSGADWYGGRMDALRLPGSRWCR